jgi:SAM-dependent methyltransferase
MRDSLGRETENLVRSWARHDPDWLCRYLVSGVEDPRLNVQSVLSRHSLIRALSGERFSSLMTEECRFAAVMNWLADFANRAGDREQLAVLLHALRRNADNAEGTPIPHYLRRTFAALPASCDVGPIPNYVEEFLTQTSIENGTAILHQSTLNIFQRLWNTALSETCDLPRKQHTVGDLEQALPFQSTRPLVPHHLPRVLEPACGSANDYRFLDAFGLGRLFEYTGFDLSEKNIQNARALFPQKPGIPAPQPRFEVANVFAIPAPDKSYDLCLVHDLFEHLSLEGVEVAAREICRVTCRSICLGFFQMDEIPEHIVRPVGEYHINLLSVDRMKALFARHGFQAQVVHLATYLRSEFACDHTHNPYAYTFLLNSI